MSKIDPVSWDISDASNNLNEGQHHRTNLDTGIKLTITEAIETWVASIYLSYYFTNLISSARKFDQREAAEIRMSLQNGVLKNDRNDDFTRMSKNITRSNNASRKARENSQRSGELDALGDEIKEGQARLKMLKAQQKELKESKTKSKGVLAVKAQSSSSGSVRSSDIPRKRDILSGRLLLFHLEWSISHYSTLSDWREPYSVHTA